MKGKPETLFKLFRKFPTYQHLSHIDLSPCCLDELTNTLKQVLLLFHSCQHGRRRNTQHKRHKYDDTQHNTIECHYAELVSLIYYAECSVFIVMLSVIVLSVIVLSVIVLSVIVLSVVKLNVVAPEERFKKLFEQSFL